MVDISFSKNKVVARENQILYLFLSKKMYGRWDNIAIDRYSRDCAGFIFSIIKYDKYCATKLLTE